MQMTRTSFFQHMLIKLGKEAIVEFLKSDILSNSIKFLI
jgi:hypothetical protein